MPVNSVKDRKYVPPSMTATDATITGHTVRTENGTQIVHGKFISRVI